MLRGAHAGFDSNILSDGARLGVGTRGRGRIPGWSENKKNISKFVRSEDRDENTSNHENKRQHQLSIQKAELTIDRKLIVLTVQNRTVHKLLNKIEEMIDTKSLFLALEILLICPIQIPINSAMSQSQYTKLSSNTYVKSSERYIRSSLMTDAGFAVVTCFSLRILLGQLEVSELNKKNEMQNSANSEDPGLGSRSNPECDSSCDTRTTTNIMKSSAEIFYPLLEVIEGSLDQISPQVPSSFSSSSSSFSSSSLSSSPSCSSSSHASTFSSSSSSLPSAFPNRTLVPSQRKPQNSSTLLSSFLSLLPSLYLHEENLRKSSATINSILSPQTPMKRVHKEDQSISYSKQSNSAMNSIHPILESRTSQNSIGKENNAATGKNGVNNNRNIDGSLSVLNGLLGGAVDRSGCAVLLLISYCLLDYTILKIRKNAAGNILTMAEDLFLNEIILKMKSNSMICKKENKNENNNVNENRNDGNTDFDSNNDEETEKLEIMVLYDIIENQVLNVQDTTVATCGLKLLISICQFSILSERIASVSWALLSTIHTQKTVLSTHLITNQINMNYDGHDDNDFLPGTDAIWPYLVSYENTAISSSLDVAINEINNISLPGHVSLRSKAIKVALNTFQSTFNIVYNKNKQKDSVVDANDIQSFKTYWISWWQYETPTLRIFGVLNLLSEIFKFYALPIMDNSEKMKNKNNKKAKRLTKNSNATSSSSSSTSFTSSPSNSSPIPIEKSFFPSLSTETSESLFSLALNSFPAIFLLAEPQSEASLNSFYFDTPQGFSGVNLNLELLNPFRCFIDICKSYIRFLHQLEELIDDGAQMRFILRTSSSCVRTTRAVLLCMEARVVCSVAWRNVQPLRVTDERNDKAGRKGNEKERKDRKATMNCSDSDTDTDDEIRNINDNNSTDNDSDDSNDENDNICDEKNNQIFDNNDVDLGSIEFLANMLDWSLALTHGVIRYSEILKNKLLHPKSGFQIPRYVINK